VWDVVRCCDEGFGLWGRRGSVLNGFVIGGGAVIYLGTRELVSVTQSIRDSVQLQVNVAKELVLIHTGYINDGLCHLRA
jgi:hypothetical protein